MASDGETVRLDVGDDRGYVGGRGSPLWTSNWRTVDYDMTLSEGIAEIAPLEPDVIGVFHATPADTTPALQVVLDQWSGPVVAYPGCRQRGLPRDVAGHRCCQPGDRRGVEAGCRQVGRHGRAGRRHVLWIRRRLHQGPARRAAGAYFVPAKSGVGYLTLKPYISGHV